VVLARDRRHVWNKITELDGLRVRYAIVCGERIEHPRVAYRPPRGKFDAINYSLNLIPEETDTVIYNDVDTWRIDYKPLLKCLEDKKVGMAYAPELVAEGPQTTLNTIFSPLQKRIPLFATGELIAIRKRILENILPLKPCKAEDTYMMFKVLELGYKVIQCDESPVPTHRTKEASKEEQYKTKVITGIYQALSLTRPPALTRLAYFLLPVISPIFMILGAKGYYTTKGIILGILLYLRGDRTGIWRQDYL
jgi:hypothetical protein